MSGTLETLLLDNSRSQELAKRARQTAMDRFRPEVIARQHVEIYQEILRIKR
jgi:hypothetical protein